MFDPLVNVHMDIPTINIAILFENPNGTLAMVLEDDFYRLQAALKKSTGRGAVQNRSFDW